MARPESLGMKTSVTQTRSSDAEPYPPTTTAQPVRAQVLSNADPSPPISTAQPMRAPVLSTRPPSSQASELTTVDPRRAEAAARAEVVRTLALKFFCCALGVAPGQLPDAARLYRYLQAPMDGAPVAMDDAWQAQLFGDGKFDQWLGKIREECLPVQTAGSAAYASVAMQRVFDGLIDEAVMFPTILCEIGARVDHLALCAALDVNLDLRSLEKLGSRLCVHFLCDTVLLPRLRLEPAAFPEPRPSADEIADDLGDAFEVYAQTFQQWLMRISERQLDVTRKDKLHRLLRTADLHEWTESNAKHLESLGPRRALFVEIADGCLSAPLSNAPMSFVLNCLLKVFESYPQRMEQQVEQLKARIDQGDAGEGSARDKQMLAQQRAELLEQQRLWEADLTFIRRQLVKIVALDWAGKQYLNSQLAQLAMAEYRPRIGAINLRAVLVRASRQQGAIAEIDEPDQ